MTEGIRAELEKALNKYFVSLTFRADDGTETTAPMCWIDRVGRTRFDFKPSVVHHYTGTIDRVISVKRTFPEEVEEVGLREAEEQPSEEIKLGEKMIEVPIGRPFPQTYGDWTNLACDIKEKDPASAPIVNDRLNVILYEEGDVDAAKRWLVEKSKELGIT